MALDAPIGTYLSDSAVPNADRITVRQLLAHRSGLAGQADTPDGPPGNAVAVCRATAAEPGSTLPLQQLRHDRAGQGARGGHGSGPTSTLVNSRDRRPAWPRRCTSARATPGWRRRWRTARARGPGLALRLGPAGGLYGRRFPIFWPIDAALIGGPADFGRDPWRPCCTGDPASGYAALSVWSYSPNLGGCIGQTAAGRALRRDRRGPGSQLPSAGPWVCR